MDQRTARHRLQGFQEGMPQTVQWRGVLFFGFFLLGQPALWVGHCSCWCSTEQYAICVQYQSVCPRNEKSHTKRLTAQRTARHRLQILLEGMPQTVHFHVLEGTYWS